VKVSPGLAGIRIRKLKFRRNDLRASFSIDSPESGLPEDPARKESLSQGNNKCPGNGSVARIYRWALLLLKKIF